MVSGINIQHDIAELNEVIDKFWKIRGKGLSWALALAGKKFALKAKENMKDALTPRKGEIEAERMAGFKSGQGLKIKNYNIPNPFGAGVLSSANFLGAYLDPNTQWRTKKAQKNAESMRKARRSAESKYLDTMNQLGRAHEVGSAGIMKVGTQAVRAKFEIMQREWHRSFVTSGFNFNIGKPGTYFSKNNKSSDALGKAESENTSNDNAQSFTFSWLGVSKQAEQINSALTRQNAQALISSAIRATAQDFMHDIQDRLNGAYKKQKPF